MRGSSHLGTWSGSSTRWLFALAAIAIVGLAQPAQAQFANFGERFGSNDFKFTNNAGASATLSSMRDPLDNPSFPANAIAVTFNFTGIAGLPPSEQGPQNAHLVYTATTTTPAVLFAGQLLQPVDMVTTLTFTRDSDSKILLKVTFVNDGSMTGQDPVIFGANGGSSATESASTSGGQTITYMSDFLAFAPMADNSLSLGYANISPVLARSSGNFLRTFTSTINGQFTSIPTPTVPGPVPEPASLALGVIGILGAGGMYMRRRQA